MNRNLLLFLTLFSASGLGAIEARAYSNQEFAQVFTPQEARIDQYRTAEIDQLNLVLSRSAPKEKQPELMLRLAELYTEKFRLFFVKENEIWNRKMDAFLQQSPERQRVTKKPVLDTSTSKKWLVNAVRVLDKIPDQKTKFDRLDEVYYFLGFNQWELGQKNLAVGHFEKIVRSFPRSKFASEAYRYIADHAFASRDFKKAKEYYEKASKTGASPARPRILYGLAWSHFKLRDPKRAMNVMKEAILESRNNSEAAKQGLALQRDAGDALALFYAEAGSVKNASAYFMDLFGEDDAAAALRQLSEIYQKQGQYNSALTINKQLQALGGSAAKVADEQRFTLMIDGLNQSTGKKDRARHTALLKSMTAEFVTNASDKDEEKFELLKAQVKKAASLAHKEGNGSNNPKESFSRAESLYRLYLTAFSEKISAEENAEVRYYLCDVLSQLGRHREAATEYKAIMDYAESNAAFRKYSKDAAAGMVFSLDQILKAKGSSKFSKEDADQVISAIDSFVKAYPKDKDATKYLGRAAGILVTSKRMEEAKPRLIEVLEKYPSSKEAFDAATILLKNAEDNRDYKGAESLARDLLSRRALMAQDRKGDFRKRLESIAEKAQFQQVRVVEENKDFAQAAKGYEKLAAESRDGEIRAKALNNAAVSFEKAGDRENEFRIYRAILEANPGDKKAEKNVLGSGNEHFLSGRYEEAAKVYEIFFGIYQSKLKGMSDTSQKEAMESLRSAALIRRALGQNDKAAENFRNIVDAANKGVEAARSMAGEFLFDSAERFKKAGNSTEAVKAYQKYLSAFPNGPHAVGATLETANLYEQLREEAKAQSFLRATISKVKGLGKKASPEDVAYGARARLEMLAPLEESFEKSPLRLPEAQLKQDISAKLAAMDRLNKGYIEVMDFGDGTWGVEAFRRMAQVYKTFAQKLENAPVPTNFSAEDKAKFKAQLKNVAKPIYLKVGETLDTAVQKGEQLQVVGPVMRSAYIFASVNNAKADRLPLVQEVDWARPSDWIMGDVPGSESDLEKKREALRKNTDELSHWISIGNYHMVKGEEDLAEIFYLFASSKNSRYPAANNNLAYLAGKEGNLSKAMAGFKTALDKDEFALAPKKNIARMQMASGLWRHAAQHYRQLEVRAGNDREVKRGVALAALAMGKNPSDTGILSQAEGTNAKFAEAILALSKGDKNQARSKLSSIESQSEAAKQILSLWNDKEND